MCSSHSSFTPLFRATSHPPLHSGRLLVKLHGVPVNSDPVHLSYRLPAFSHTSITLSTPARWSAPQPPLQMPWLRATRMLWACVPVGLDLHFWDQGRCTVVLQQTGIHKPGFYSSYRHYLWHKEPKSILFAKSKQKLSRCLESWQSCGSLSPLLLLEVGSREEQTQSYHKSRAAQGNWLFPGHHTLWVFITFFWKAAKQNK